jgi:hypothetical protein
MNSTFQSYAGGLRQLKAINLARKSRLECFLQKDPNYNRRQLDDLVNEIRQIDSIIALLESGVRVVDQFARVVYEIQALKAKDHQIGSLIITLQFSDGNPNISGLINMGGINLFGGPKY